MYQPKTISTDMLVSDGKYLVYGANGIIGRYDEYNHEQPEVLMTCRGATCGSINISKPFSWINGNAMVVHPKYNNLGQSFLKYLLQGIDLSCVITGAAQPQITRQSLQPVKVVVPPILEQEKIVAELDCLTGIIEKKKQQLEELDKLAQSIFYDMFGDPITNEKGWEMKRLEDISSLITDGSHYSPQNDENGDIPMLSVKDMQQTRFSYDACKWIGREEYAKLLANGCKPLKNDVLIAKDGSFFKYIFVLTEEREQAILSSIAILRPKTSVVNPRFVSGYLSTAEVFSKVEREYLTGTAIKRVILKGIRRMPIILPPLSNQNEFAQKVEAIEKQKELVKQSIVETETLFNSRMDYWFN